jgi:hypothetical protein
MFFWFTGSVEVRDLCLYILLQKERVGHLEKKKGVCGA